MILKEFGFHLKFLAYSTASCIEGRGAPTVKIQLSYAMFLEKRFFSPAGITKTVIATFHPKEELVVLILKKCTCKPLVEQYPTESSTAQSGTDRPGVRFFLSMEICQSWSFALQNVWLFTHDLRALLGGAITEHPLKCTGHPSELTHPFYSRRVAIHT